MLDIENLQVCAVFAEGGVRATMVEYQRVVDTGPGDHMIMASSHKGALAAWFGFSRARRLVRSGPDGADLALLEAAENENLPYRLDRVVIGSGNGLFSEAAGRLQQQDCSVTVVSRPGALSTRLRLAVHDIRYLGIPDPAPVVAMPKRAA